MSAYQLPADIARCNGMKFFADCVDCLRRTSPPQERQVHMQPPKMIPCNWRIEPSKP
jgi:hypothetical protein